MSDPTTDEIARGFIILIVAEEVIGRYLADVEFAEWEDFGDIGEYNWDRVLEAVKEKAKAIRPSTEEFEAAYKWLSDRATQ